MCILLKNVAFKNVFKCLESVKGNQYIIMKFNRFYWILILNKPTKCTKVKTTGTNKKKIHKIQKFSFVQLKECNLKTKQKIILELVEY